MITWEQLRVGREQHAFVCGKTGSGKSKLAEFLVNDPYKAYSVVWDPKHSRTISEWKNQTFIYDFQTLKNAVEAKRIVYRPPTELFDDEDEQDRFFKWVYQQGHVRLYVDELSSLLGGSRPNFWLKLCLMLGRERGISVVTTIQRPVSMPLITYTEASKIYVFKLQEEDDRRRIEKATGITDEQQQSLRGHEFFFYDDFTGALPQKLQLNLNAIELV